LSRYKTENGRLKNELVDLEDRLQEDGHSSTTPGDWEAERSNLQSKVEHLESEMRSSSSALNDTLASLKLELEMAQRQRDDALKSGDDASAALSARLKEFEQLQSEKAEMEQRARDAEQKVSLLLDQVENSVDNYRRQSRQAMGGPATEAVVNGANSVHSRNESSEAGSVGLGARNSAALDNLASELETLRTHWEATNKNYRMSNNFDFDPPNPGHKPSDSNGLSESLADWRKRLDNDDGQGSSEKTPTMG
jgi:chromosome segregation ATPase